MQPRWYIYPQVSMHCPRYAYENGSGSCVFSHQKIASLFYLRDFLAFLILYLKIFEECALVMATIHGHILAIFMPSIHGIPWNPKGSAYPLEEPFVIASEDEVMAGAIVDTVEL